MCSKCGYDRIIFPNTVPDAITRFEDKRKRVLGKLLQERLELKTQVERIGHDAQLKIEQLNDSMLKAIKDLQETKEIIKRYLQIITSYKEALAKQNQEIADLKRSLDDANRKLKDTTPPALRGLLVIYDIYKNRKVLPIYFGDNTYGSTPTKGTHQEIRSNINGFSFSPLHFRIRAGANALIMLPLAGGIQNQKKELLPANGEYINNDSEFTISDKVTLKFILELSGQKKK